MKRMMLLFVLSVLVPSTVAVSSVRAMEGSPDELVLVVGEQRVLDASEIESFSESTRGIIEVKIPKSGRKLIVTALRPGNTSLLLLKRTNEQRHLAITVFARQPKTIISEMSKLVGDSPGIRFVQIGPRVFVDGNVATEAELTRMNQIISLYPGQVQSLVQVGSAVKRRTNIRLDLTFVELHSSDSLEGGMNWPGQFGDSGSVSFSYDMVTGMPQASYRIVNQAIPSFHAAQAKGFAKIKKRAYLVTTNGNSATYSSGGEINIPVVGSQAAELRTVPYGCNLTVLPHIDAQEGLIDLKVEAEVSELKETSQNAPGRTLSKVSTLVHLGLGQSIVLSGLDSHTESKTKSGLPFLSRIPIFGMLFGTHQKRSEKVTGLIAITPVVLDNIDRDSRRKIKEALQRFKQSKLL